METYLKGLKAEEMKIKSLSKKRIVYLILAFVFILVAAAVTTLSIVFKKDDGVIFGSLTINQKVFDIIFHVLIITCVVFALLVTLGEIKINQIKTRIKERTKSLVSIQDEIVSFKCTKDFVLLNEAIENFTSKFDLKDLNNSYFKIGRKSFDIEIKSKFKESDNALCCFWISYQEILLKNDAKFYLDSHKIIRVLGQLEDKNKIKESFYDDLLIHKTETKAGQIVVNIYLKEALLKIEKIIKFYESKLRLIHSELEGEEKEVIKSLDYDLCDFYINTRWLRAFGLINESKIINKIFE